MSDSRYSCQVKLPGFGKDAQAKLARSKVLIVGLGGLGCPASGYLVAAGIGEITLVDFDHVSVSNLHRQTLYGPADVGKLKVDAAARKLRLQNPQISIETITTKVTTKNVLDLVKPYDIVIDCTDNFSTRYILNDGCVLASKPLVYGAAYQYEGQVAIWNTPNPDGSRSPHYRDIFPEDQSTISTDCDSGGVLPTLTGIIGSMEANEAIKFLGDLPGLLSSKLLVFNALNMETNTIQLPLRSKIAISQLGPELPEITVQQLRSSLPHNEYRLIDVRTANEHDKFNIGGQLIPLEDLLAGKHTLKDTKPIVFYCSTGNRSLVAARYAAQNHPKSTTLSLAGGIVAWQQEPRT